MKCLVVDDSKLARLSLIKSLKEYVDTDDISQAGNGQEAVDSMANDKADIVFLDLTMPVMDGYQALPKLIELNPKTNVVVVSADVQEQAKTKVLGSSTNSNLAVTDKSLISL